MSDQKDFESQVNRSADAFERAIEGARSKMTDEERDVADEKARAIFNPPAPATSEGREEFEKQVAAELGIDLEISDEYFAYCDDPEGGSAKLEIPRFVLTFCVNERASRASDRERVKALEEEIHFVRVANGEYADMIVASNSALDESRARLSTLTGLLTRAKDAMMLHQPWQERLKEEIEAALKDKT